MPKVIKVVKPTKTIKIIKRPKTNITIAESLKIYEKESIDHPVPFAFINDITATLYMSVIMKKHNNDCVLLMERRANNASDKSRGVGGKKMITIIIKENGSVFITDTISTRAYTQLDSNDKMNDFAKIIAKRYLECKKHKKALAIPIAFQFDNGGAHANILIFNFERNELERFEPHGAVMTSRPLSFTNGLNKTFKTLTSLINKNLPADEQLTFIPPYKICIRGLKSFQSYENDNIKEHLFKSDEFGGYEVLVTKDDGYCGAFSLFYLDLRLTELKKSGLDIFQEVTAEISKNPAIFKNFIRGLTNKFLKETVKLLHIAIKKLKINPKLGGRYIYLVYVGKGKDKLKIFEDKDLLSLMNEMIELQQELYFKSIYN